MKLRDVGIVNLILCVLILFRISWQFLDYNGVGIIFMVLYFIAFLGVLGENTWGFWWVLILGLFEFSRYFFVEGLGVYILIFSIVLIVLSLMGIFGWFNKSILKK